MADKGKGAKHLTELTLGIEGIKEALDEAQKVVEERSKEIGGLFAENIKSSFKDLEINTSKIQEQSRGFNEVASGISKAEKATERFVKTTTTFKNGDLENAVKKVTSSYFGMGQTLEVVEEKVKDANGNISKDLKETSRSIIEDEKKRNDELKKLDESRRKQEEKRLKEKETAIKKETQAGQRRKRQFENEQKSIESSYKKQISNLDKLVSSQNKFVNKLNSQEPGFVDEKAISSAENYSRLLKRIQSDALKSGKITNQQANQIRILKDKIKELSEAYDKATVKRTQSQIFLRDAKAEENSLKKQIKLEQKKKQEREKAEKAAESSYKRQISNIETIISKQRNLLNTLNSQKPDKYNQEMINSGEKYLRLLNHIKKDAKQSGNITSQQINQAEILGRKVSDLSNKYGELNAKRKSEIAIRKVEKAQQKEYDDSVRKLDTLIKKQKEFTSLVGRQKTSSVNKQLIADSKEATEAMEKLNDEIRKSGKVSADQSAQIDILASKNKQLAGTYEEAGAKGDSFLKKVSDKAKWLGAFYIVDGLMKSLGEAIGVIKEAEDAAIELQRVISVDLTQGDISKQLYSIAGEYGREFADVQEVALRFAQAGYEWNDVLKLTESTMLALNTAELDVEQSTQGLIAITSQWNIEAKDTELLIDKINRTADHFPVTSEKIVAALQRASSSAKNAGLKIEETIGVITALSEATGRSGENIGTALNSLLIYTSKDKALKTFYEVGNETVKKTVTSYKAGAASILDVWRALSQNLAELSEEQQAALLKGVDTDELGMHLEEEATEITSDIRAIYGSAGTFRQNYLIALLKNIDTVKDAMDGMNFVSGYSTRENAKQMQTLTAAFNKFKAVWKGLVVDVGEGDLGLKSFAKTAVNVGTVVGKTIKIFGGLKPIIIGVTGAITLLKKESLQKTFSGISEGFKEIKEKGSSLIEIFKQVRSGNLSLSEAFEKAGMSSASFATKIGVAQLALSALMAVYGAATNAVKAYRQEQAEERQLNLESTKEKLDQNRALKETAERFIELAEKESRTNKESQELYKSAKELGISLQDVGTGANGATGNMNELADAMARAKDIMNGLSKAEWEDRIKGLEEEFLASTEKDGFLGLPINNLEVSISRFMTTANDTEKKAVEIFSETMDKYKKEVQSQSGDIITTFSPLGDDPESKIQFINDMKKALEELNEESRNTEGIGKTEIYSQTTSAIEKTEATLDNLVESQVEYQYAQNNAKEALDGTKESLDAYIQKIIENIGYGDEFDEQIKEMVVSLLEAAGIIPSIGDGMYGLADGIAVSAETIANLDEAVNNLSESLDDMQSGLDAVYNAYDEFNELGYLNLDTIQALIAAGGDYISCLEFTENGIAINEEAMGKLIDAQRTNALEMIKQAAVSDALKIVQEHLRDETSNVEAASNSLTSSLTGTEAEVANLTVQYLNGAIAANEFARQTAQAANIAAPGKIDRAALESDLKSAVGGYKGFYDYVQSSFTSIEHYSSKASKGMAKDAKSAGRAAEKAARDATQAIKKELNEQKKAVKERYDAEIKEIDKAKKAAQKKYDSAKKALEKEKDAVSDSYDAQKDALEDQKDAIKDYYDAQIDALKDVQKENDRLDKQEEYLKRKREAEKDIAKASVRSGVEWREKEAEAREKLGEVESDREKELRDQQIEDQIAALEKERDAQIKAIEEQIKGIERAKEAALESIEAQMEALEEQKEREMEALEAKKEKLQEQRDAEIKAIEDKIAAAENANKTMAGNYQSTFLEPTLAATKEGFDRTFSGVANSWAKSVQEMSSNADSLIAKIGKAGERIQRSLGPQKLGGDNWKGVTQISTPPAQRVPTKPNPNTGAYSNGASGRLGDTAKASSNGTYVTNTSNQMFANIFTDSSAKVLGSKFFTRP